MTEAVRALILIAGPAGSGKSFIASRIAARLPGTVVLDKDDLAKAPAEDLLRRHGASAHDRESETYLRKVRPREYALLMESALAVLGAGHRVLAVAPFASELSDSGWLDDMRERAALGRATLGILWVAADASTMRRRIHMRAAPRDGWKLEHWDDYARRTAFAAPPVAPLHRIANGAADAGRLEEELRLALDFIVGLEESGPPRVAP